MMLILMLNMMLKFYVKESPNLVGLENVWAAEFAITRRSGWCSPYQSKSDHISTHQSLPHPYLKFLHSANFYIIIN